MNYYQYAITAEPALNDILIALFSQMPFDTFEEKTTGFDAYLPENEDSPEVVTFLKALQQDYPFVFEKIYLPAQNWNELWESNFHPVLVENFVGIRADFHLPISEVEHELVINPKMAFGTGHHETTWMVMRLMRAMDFQGKKVLDYGCGTGVLAILASRLGAAEITAVDIEQESFENTKENCRANAVSNVVAICGTIDNVTDIGYGIILANINRNVILDSLPALSLKMQPGGRLVVSGFIEADEAFMRQALAGHGFQIEEISRKNNWLAMLCEKKVDKVDAG